MPSPLIQNPQNSAGEKESWGKEDSKRHKLRHKFLNLLLSWLLNLFRNRFPSCQQGQVVRRALGAPPLQPLANPSLRLCRIPWGSATYTRSGDHVVAVPVRSPQPWATIDQGSMRN
jgi:hypothetical protein